MFGITTTTTTQLATAPVQSAHLNFPVIKRLNQYFIQLQLNCHLTPDQQESVTQWMNEVYSEFFSDEKLNDPTEFAIAVDVLCQFLIDHLQTYCNLQTDQNIQLHLFNEIAIFKNLISEFSGKTLTEVEALIDDIEDCDDELNGVEIALTTLETVQERIDVFIVENYKMLIGEVSICFEQIKLELSRLNEDKISLSQEMFKKITKLNQTVNTCLSQLMLDIKKLEKQGNELKEAEEHCKKQIDKIKYVLEGVRNAIG